jgi:hypothetical protein
MASVFSYSVKAKYILIIRVQCPAVTLIETRKSLKQSEPQSNPDIVLRSIKMGKKSRTSSKRKSISPVFLSFSTGSSCLEKRYFYKNVLNTVSNFVQLLICTSKSWTLCIAFS